MGVVMKKRKLIILFCTMLLCGTGCGKQELPVAKATDSVTSDAIPEKKVKIEKKAAKQKLFGEIGFNEENCLEVTSDFQNLVESKQVDYQIEDRIYEQSGHKGEFDIHYPYFKGDTKKFERLNSLILTKIVEMEGYGKDETLRRDELQYEIKTATKEYVSILFSGTSSGEGAAHPINLSFAVNFDMEYEIPLYIPDIIISQNDILEKVHSAMKEQWDYDCMKGFEQKTVKEMEMELFGNDEVFYVEKGKLYLQFSILVGAGFHDFVSFDTEPESGFVPEERRFKSIGFTSDKTITFQQKLLDLFQSGKPDYEIEGKAYTQDKSKVKGKFDVHYPVLVNGKQDMSKANQLLVEKVEKFLVYDTEEETSEMELDYTIESATKDYISILFEGGFYAKTSPHPNSITFCVNLDLKNQCMLDVYDYVDMGTDKLEKVHTAMKEQLDSDGLEAFETMKTSDIKQQLRLECYLKDKKLYQLFQMPVGSGYYEYIVLEGKRD